MSIGRSVRRHVGAIQTALRHLLTPRMTVKYPDVHQVPIESNYAFDPKKGAAIPGWRGRHLLYLDRCTGCNLCYIACENIAEAIVMVTLPDEKRPQNKKSLYPAVDYGRCVFCGFCVDFCPFYALEMTPDQELSEYKRENLFYTPHELAIPPKRPARPYVNPQFEGESVRHIPR